MAALDSPEDRPTLAWRPSVRRRAAVLALTLLAVGLAIAVVARIISTRTLLRMFRLRGARRIVPPAERKAS